MTRPILLISVSIALVVAIEFGSAGYAAGYGPTPESKDLRAIIESDPAIKSALLESLAEAEWDGIDTLDEFYAYIDKIVRLVPSSVPADG